TVFVLEVFQLNLKFGQTFFLIALIERPLYFIRVLELVVLAVNADLVTGSNAIVLTGYLVDAGPVGPVVSTPLVLLDDEGRGTVVDLNQFLFFLVPLVAGEEGVLGGDGHVGPGDGSVGGAVDAVGQADFMGQVDDADGPGTLDGRLQIQGPDEHGV